jgi:hypothetical protein
MWLLIIFSAVVNASPGGGVSHSVTTVSFAEEAPCTAAKSRLGAGISVPAVVPGYSNVVPIINGVCVKVK